MTKGFKCDDCKEFFAFSKPTAKIDFSGDGQLIPLFSTKHLCEKCAKTFYKNLSGSKGGL